MKRRTASARSGFTFLELVASLALILLTLAFLFPTFARARESARRSSCMSNLHQLGVALHLYAQDYNGMYPMEDNQWSNTMPYVKNYSVYACPNEPPSSQRENGWETGVANQGAPGTFLFSSYQLKGGLANDLPGNTPVSRDWSPWDMNGIDVLSLDGNVKWSETRLAPHLTDAPRPRP